MVTAAMTDLLLHPLGIYVLALGAGFLIPLFDRAHRGSAILLFLLALTCMVAIAGFNLFGIINGAAAIDIETAGIKPPFSINLRFGLLEGSIVFAVNSVALLGAWHYLPRLKEHASALLLYLILVMGINGMVMTRGRRFQIHHRDLDRIGILPARHHIHLLPDRYIEHR